MLRSFVLLVCGCCLAGMAMAANVTIVKGGKPLAAIYVPAEVMDPVRKDRERLRASVQDLSLYLGRIGGAKIEIFTREPSKGEKLLPILIGEYAGARFGAVQATSLYKQGWRLAVSQQGIGMLGESDEAVSYAIYELLDRLGCRWYTPGDLGESIPSLSTITLPEMNLSAVPPILGRNIGRIDADYQRRNRCGGLAIECNDLSLSMRNYLSKEQLAAHPAWNAELDGKREVSGFFCWSNPEVVEAVAAAIIAKLDAKYQPVVTLSTPYNGRFCACADCRKLDAGGVSYMLGGPSMTDRYVYFGNRVAERVTTKYPDLLFGMLMNANYIDPPLREKPHANLLPVITSINYCRAHSLTDPACDTRERFRVMLEGWGKLTQRLAVYEYGYNLAEVTAPYPMLRWVKDIPVMFANHAKFWMPAGWVNDVVENYDASLPGMYLGIRLGWYPQADPTRTLNEFYTGFYGAAAGQMRRYWQRIDDAWQHTPEHAGRFFGFDRRFTPEVLAEARSLMNDALDACKTPLEYRRVKLADDNLRQFEVYMAMRRNLTAGKLATLGPDADRWLAVRHDLGKEFGKYYAFASFGYIALPNGVYPDATRIAKNYTLLTPPITPWRCRVAQDADGDAGWEQPAFNDADWQLTNPSVDTWASLGLFRYFGAMRYRAKVKAPAVPAGKRVYLWISMADDTCRLVVNGQAIPYLDAKGDAQPEAKGYLTPFSFDVTDALKPGGENLLAISVLRSTLNELGTGGLMGPVLLYREK